MGGVEGVDSGAKDRLVEVIGCWPCSPSQRGVGRAQKRREKREREGVKREGCDAKLERGTDHWKSLSVSFSTSTHARRLLSSGWIAHLL